MNRDHNIDILKVIGLSCVILAHVSCPYKTIFVIRSFDVPLMVFASGLAYSGRTIPPLKVFFTKRLLRLLIPVYAFLLLYFSGEALLDRLPDGETMLRTFLLLDGIGYVWIIRVFILMMLIIPLMKYLPPPEKIWRVIVISIGMFLAYECFYDATISFMPKALKSVIYYLIGYGIILYVGFSIKRVRNHIMSVWLLLWLFTVFYFLYRGENNPYTSKYPPHGLFISYGLTCSIFLFAILRWISSMPFRMRSSVCKGVDLMKSLRSSIENISKHVIWIYLWHIPLLEVVFYCDVQSWMLRYLLVYSGAVIIVLLQVRVINCIAQRISKKNISAFLINHLTR